MADVFRLGLKASEISYDFSMVSPSSKNGFFGTDSGSSDVSSRSEPMVLRSSSCSGLKASVSDSVTSVLNDVVDELDVVAGY